jgi:hypothetical protein
VDNLLNIIQIRIKNAAYLTQKSLNSVLFLFLFHLVNDFQIVFILVSFVLTEAVDNFSNKSTLCGIFLADKPVYGGLKTFSAGFALFHRAY